MHLSKFQSKTWSCNSLMAGAAKVVDSSALPLRSTLAVHEEELARQLGGLSVEQLEALMQDHFAQSEQCLVKLEDYCSNCSTIYCRYL